MIKLLNTTVHVESRSLFCNALNTSPTPASPECVAIRMCSMYFVLGGAACYHRSGSATGRPWMFPGQKATHLDLGRAFDRFFEGARHCERFDGSVVVDGNLKLVAERSQLGIQRGGVVYLACVNLVPTQSLDSRAMRNQGGACAMLPGRRLGLIKGLNIVLFNSLRGRKTSGLPKGTTEGGGQRTAG